MTAKDFLLSNDAGIPVIAQINHPLIQLTLNEILRLMDDFAEHKINEYLESTYPEDREFNEMDLLSEEELKMINKELEDEINSNF
jgi:hypothetical protein